MKTDDIKENGYCRKCAIKNEESFFNFFFSLDIFRIATNQQGSISFLEGY